MKMYTTSDLKLGILTAPRHRKSTAINRFIFLILNSLRSLILPIFHVDRHPSYKPLLILLFLAFYSPLFSVPLKVPTHLYNGAGKNRDHPGNAPLISDLTFRAISDHVIDQGTEWFDPKIVQQGDTIYINLCYIQWFHSQVHDEIDYPYILIGCDVGNWLPDPVLQNLFYEPKLAAFFCRNILLSHHPKLFQIPMGQTDHYFGYSSLPLLQQLSEQQPFEKKYLLYMNYYPRSFGDRDQIVKLFENEPYCFSRNHSGKPYSGIPKEDFYREIATSHFVVSPVGFEMDCVRTWESLALGSIPIVEHSFLDHIFEDLPVLLVDDWKEINETFLKENLPILSRKRRDKAFFPYWKKQIEEMQTKVRRDDLSSSYLEATLWPNEELDLLLEILEEEKNPLLLCKGFMTTLHSLQIAQAAPYIDTISLRDPFLYQESLDWLNLYYLGNLAFLPGNDRIKLISEKEFYQEIENGNPLSFHYSPIFLDLSYQRSSLLRTFEDFRCSLRKDLEEIYNKMFPGVLLCGNGYNDRYVEKVLSQLAQEYEIEIRQKGDFWFFRKN